jgi:DNA-binding Xre family transcriptional regulator
MISKKELMQRLEISLNEVKKIENGELAGIPAENIFD